MNKVTNVVLGSAVILGSTVASTAVAEPVNLYGTVEARTIDRDDTDLDTFLDAARLGAKQVVQLEKFEDLRARWQLEFDLANNAGQGTDDRDVGDVGVRKAQINLIGGFGEFIFGRQNNLMAAAKKIDQFKNDSGSFVFGPDRVGNAVSYVTPSFGGLNAYAQVVSDVNTASTDDEDADATTFGLSYVGDGLDLQLSRFDVEDDADNSEQELLSVGASVGLGAATVFGTYQDEDVSGDDMWGVGVAYGINDLTLKAGYSETERGSGAEGSYVQLLADYNLGQGVSAFAQYIEFDSDAENTLGRGDAVSVGIAFNFSTDIAL